MKDDQAPHAGHRSGNNLIAIEKAFSAFAERAASGAGTPVAFVVAISFTVAGLLAGPIVHYSMTWQMLMSLTPAFTTFLLVFLIQKFAEP